MPKSDRSLSFACSLTNTGRPATVRLEQAGGFWLDVNVWGDRHAAEVTQLVKKGARVHVIGRLAESKWTVTATGEERRAFFLNADRLLPQSRAAR